MLGKIIKIIIIIILLAAAGLGAYWYFDRQQGGSGIPLVGDNNLTFRDLFPFGTSGTDTPPPPVEPAPTTNPDITDTGPIVVTPPPRLWPISNEPQSGAVVFNATNANTASASGVATGTPMVHFADKATGHLYESALNSLGIRRISNTTIPKVYEAMWQLNGNALVLRYLDDKNENIISVYGKLAAAQTSTTTLETSFLPSNISSLSVNHSTGALAYAVKSQTGSTIFVTAAATAAPASKTPSATGLGAPKNIFETPVNDLAVFWVNNTTLGLLSKPSAGVIGQFYFLKTDSGRLERILGNKTGLVATANPAGTKIFFSESKNSGFVSGLFNPKTGEVTQTPFVTTPDKCVWSNKTAYLYCAVPKTIPVAKYPDAWYQGRVSFSDDFWRIDTATGATEFLIDPLTATENNFDAIGLALDPSENYLVFTNKKDARLWGLRIQP